MVYPAYKDPLKTPGFEKIPKETQLKIVKLVEKSNRESLDIAEKQNKFRKQLIDQHAIALKILNKHVDSGLIERASAKIDLELGRFKEVLDKISRLQATYAVDIIEDTKQHIESLVKWDPNKATFPEAADYMELAEGVRDKLTGTVTSEAQRAANLIKMILRSELASKGFEGTIDHIRKTWPPQDKDSLSKIRETLDRIHSDNITLQLAKNKQNALDSDVIKRLISENKIELKKKEGANMAKDAKEQDPKKAPPKTIADQLKALEHPFFKCKYKVDGATCEGNHSTRDHDKVVDLQRREKARVETTAFNKQKQANAVMEEKINAARLAGIAEGKTIAEAASVASGSRTSRSDGYRRDDQHRDQYEPRRANAAHHSDHSDWEERSTMSARSDRSNQHHANNAIAMYDQATESQVSAIVEARLHPIMFNLHQLYEQLAYLKGSVQYLFDRDHRCIPEGQEVCCMTEECDDEEQNIDNVLLLLGLTRTEMNLPRSDIRRIIKEEPKTVVKQEPAIASGKLAGPGPPIHAEHGHSHSEAQGTSMEDIIHLILGSMNEINSGVDGVYRLTENNVSELQNIQSGMEVICSDARDSKDLLDRIDERVTKEASISRTTNVAMMRMMAKMSAKIDKLEEELTAWRAMPSRDTSPRADSDDIPQQTTAPTGKAVSMTTAERTPSLDSTTEISTPRSRPARVERSPNSLRPVNAKVTYRSLGEGIRSNSCGRGSVARTLSTPGQATFNIPRSSGHSGVGHGYGTRSSTMGSPIAQREEASLAQEAWPTTDARANNAKDKAPMMLDSGCTNNFLSSAEGATIIGPATGSIVFGGNDKLRMPMKFKVHRKDTGSAIVVEGLPQELHSVSKYGSLGRDSLFHRGRCYIFDRRTLEVLRVGRERQGLYYLDDQMVEKRSIAEILGIS